MIHPSSKSGPPKPYRRRSALTPQQKNDRQGRRGESEFRQSAEVVGGFIHRLYDTKDYQERIGASLAKCSESYVHAVDDLLVPHPKLRKGARSNGQYVDLQESIRAYGYQQKLMAQKQPGDFLWLLRGSVRFVEVKTSKHVTHLPHANIRESQMLTGCRVQEEGGNFYFFVIRYDAKHKHTGYWICASSMYDLWLQGGSQGIAWHSLGKVSVKVPLLCGKERAKMGCRWDLSVVLGGSQTDLRSVSK